VIDKRKFERKSILSECSVKRLFLKEKLFPSQIVNYSPNGLMLKADIEFQAGDAVTIYLSEEAQNQTHLSANYCVGMVRWCAEQIGNIGGFYGVGIELAHPAVNAT